MAMELKHLNPQHVMDVTGNAIDDISRLRQENAELKSDNADLRDDKKLTDAILDERNAEIAELEESHKMEVEQLLMDIVELKSKLELYKRGFAEDDRINAYLYAELRHQKYKRCLDKAKTLDRDATLSNFMIVTEKEDGQKENHKKKAAFYRKWSDKWLDLAELMEAKLLIPMQPKGWMKNADKLPWSCLNKKKGE